MSKELDAKLKTALDESRLLILGAQVLFGFAFQAAFQELFAEVDAAGRTMQIFALGLLSITLPKLVRDKDLNGILHCHTTRRRGFEYFGVTDHSQSAHY